VVRVVVVLVLERVFVVGGKVENASLYNRNGSQEKGQWVEVHQCAAQMGRARECSENVTEKGGMAGCGCGGTFVV
jgi:hypothetical protein